MRKAGGKEQREGEGAPKAAAYYEVDGGEWYWWDGAWGDKWEPKKKKKKHTEAEWEQWYEEHPKGDTGTESSKTPRKPAEPETPPTQRPRIRPRRRLNSTSRKCGPMDSPYMPEVVMREVEYVISGQDTAWMTKPPAVKGFESRPLTCGWCQVLANMGESSHVSTTSGDRMRFIQITPPYQKGSTS